MCPPFLSTEGKTKGTGALAVIGILLSVVVLVGAVLAWRETWWALSEGAWRYDRVDARGTDRYLVAVLAPALAVTLVPRWARGFLTAAEDRASGAAGARLALARRLVPWVSAVGALGALPAVALSFAITEDAWAPSLGTSLARST